MVKMDREVALAESEEKDRYFGGMGETFEPGYTLDEILDNAAMSDEIRQSGIRINRTAALHRIYLEQHPLPSTSHNRQEQALLAQATSKFDAVVDYLIALEKTTGERVDEGAITLGEVSLGYLLRVGSHALLRETAEHQRKYAKQNSLLHLYSNASAKEFHYTTGASVVEIDGISLFTFMDPGANVPLSDLYRFMTDAMLVQYRRNHEELARPYVENEKRYLSGCPNIGIYAFQIISEGVQGGLNYAENVVDEYMAKNNKDKIALEVGQRAKRFGKRVESIQGQMYRLLLDPKGNEAARLIDVMGGFLRGSRSEMMVALPTIGIKDRKRILEMYRRGRELSSHETYGPFYRDLCDSLEEYCREMPDQYLVSKNEAGAILDVDQERDFIIPDTAVVKDMLFAAVAIAPKDNYTAVPGGHIDTGRLIPARVLISPHPDEAGKCVMGYHWENEKGETTDILLTFDKRGGVEWNFLESPDDPEMEDVRAAFLFASYAILRNVPGVMSANIATNGNGNGVKERVVDEIYALRKQAREEGRRAVETSPNNPEKENTPRPVKGVRRIIHFPPGKTPEGFVRKFDSTEGANILKAIDRFNEDGLGVLSRKHRRDKNGRVIYALAVKGKRVLVYEENSEEGVQNLWVSDIDYHERIYRNAHIE